MADKLIRTSAALLLTAMLLAACGRSGGPASASQAEPDGQGGDSPFWRGMTISCHRSGPGEWDGPMMQPTLDHLMGLGVNAISIHPYARIGNDGSVGSRRGVVESATVMPVQWANARGMTTFVKPHLAYWGSQFSWRGKITFDNEQDWQRFFEQYTTFIVHQAELAERADADLFAVGTELHLTLHREADWRRVIAAIRAVYHGKLTYAANWDEKQAVPFWDEMDFIGVQFYYPLSQAMPPSDDDLRRGLGERVAQLSAFAKEQGKPIVLTELGYAQSEEAAMHPWSDRVVGDPQRGAELKLRCMRLSLEAIEKDPSIKGVFLWKWFPSDRDHSNEFVLQYDAMRQVLREAWAANAPTEPQASAVARR